MDLMYLELKGVGVIDKKGSNRSWEGFPISVFFSLSFILFELKKDMLIDSNQVCNLIRIG